ncbi:hypothetical protein EG832_10625 [bacterium]|nr:hypothetical protein [bacterium]
MSINLHFPGLFLFLCREPRRFILAFSNYNLRSFYFFAFLPFFLFLFFLFLFLFFFFSCVRRACCRFFNNRRYYFLNDLFLLS